ncbi:hypothetical protein BS78_08G132600 [Paspalum vaginatum]|nr:hypothetical protein BS78_08G132600 [Paspalum vaginatum]
MHRASKVDFQPLVDRVVAYIPRCEGYFFTKREKLIFVRTILSAISVLLAIALGLSPWTVESIDHLSILVRARKRLSVAQALTGGRWLLDVRGELSLGAHVHLLWLWDFLRFFCLNPDMRDSAPNKCHFFLWLALHGRCWTSDRRFRHERETVDHLLLRCVHSKEIWFRFLLRLGIQHVAPSALDGSFASWWLEAKKQVAKSIRKRFDSLVVLVAWCLWKERNNRIFRLEALQPVALTRLIMDEAGLWGCAGFTSIAGLLAARLL